VSERTARRIDGTVRVCVNLFYEGIVETFGSVDAWYRSIPSSGRFRSPLAVDPNTYSVNPVKSGKYDGCCHWRGGPIQMEV